MIKETSKDKKEINMSHLYECLEKKFSHSIYSITSNGNVILFSYKKPSNPWFQATLEVKQPVISMYDENGNLLAYATPNGQDDFERTFAKGCYKILNDLE